MLFVGLVHHDRAAEMGEPAIRRQGSDLTIVTIGAALYRALEAAEELAKYDVSTEVIDLRSLKPLDVDTIAKSVNKTGRCLVAHEATRFCGYGAELVATVQKECFWHLEAPISRVTGWDTPYPHAFEWQYFPVQRRLVDGIRKVMEAG